MKARIRYVTVYWLPIILYGLLIFIQSSFSFTQEIQAPPHLDKLVHCAVYAALGALFFRAFSTLWFKHLKMVVLLASITASTLYGVSDELHQIYVPLREASLFDILADAIGSTLGVFFSAKWTYNCSFPR